MIQNNVRGVGSGHGTDASKFFYVGKNVNQFREKQTNVTREAKSRVSISGSTGQDVALGDHCVDGHVSMEQNVSAHCGALANSEKQIQKDQDVTKRRLSSNKSVASIEMEGENLVVVTEEVIDDETFVKEHEYESQLILGTNDDAQNSVTKYSQQCLETLDNNYSCTKSMVNDLKQETRAPDTCSHLDLEQRTRAPDSIRRLDLRLNLNVAESCDEKVSDFNFLIPGSSSSSSPTTSGPDTPSPSKSRSVVPPSASPVILSSSCVELEGDLCKEVEPISDQDVMKMTYNMSFPDNCVAFADITTAASSHTIVVDQICGVFSVDLGLYSNRY